MRRDQGKVLGNHADALPDGIFWRIDRYRQAVYVDLPFIGLVQPIQDAHQRSLTGPILTQQGVDLTRAQGKIDLVVSQYRTEALANPAHRNYRIKITGHIFASTYCQQIPGYHSLDHSSGLHEGPG